MFALAVGCCFAFWPQRVNRQFETWRNGSVESAEDGRISIRRSAAVYAISRMGGLLIGLIGYLAYHWIRFG
jgi:hypothetical protein